MALPNGGALPNEEYSNNKRTVTSSTSVLDTDSLLNVNTTSGAITITLKEIPTKFSTMYSLYIKDIGNYSATNNITITAPTGFKINGQQSVVINTNGLSCQIIITSNTDYVCNGLSSAVVGVQDYDTGWIDLQGFSFMASGTRPQYRVIDRLIMLRGTAVVPLSVSAGGAVVSFTTEQTYRQSPNNSRSVPFYSAAGTGDIGSVLIQNPGAAPYGIMYFNGKGLAATPTFGTNVFSVFNNSIIVPDGNADFYIEGHRRANSQTTTQYCITYNLPCTLRFTTEGLMYLSLVTDYEDAGESPFGAAPTYARRIIGTNSVTGEYASNFDALNYGNAVASTDTIVKGITSSLYKHAITVDIDDARTLGGFNIPLDGITMAISRSIPLTTIHP